MTLLPYNCKKSIAVRSSSVALECGSRIPDWPIAALPPMVIAPMPSPPVLSTILTTH